MMFLLKALSVLFQSKRDLLLEDQPCSCLNVQLFECVRAKKENLIPPMRHDNKESREEKGVKHQTKEHNSH